MERLIKALLALVLAGTAARAQEPKYAYASPEPTYIFRTVVRPGMTIGGHTFTPYDTIGTAVINEIGDVAFIASWPDDPPKTPLAVFTLHRIVVSNGDVINGKTVSLSPTSRLAINDASTVAFEARTENASVLIFIERFAPPLGQNPDTSYFTLNDNDQIILGGPAPGCDATATASRPKGATECGPFSMLQSNSSGQIVIPINTAQGPFLLVGSPAK